MIDAYWPKRRPPNHALVNDEADGALTDAVVKVVLIRGLEYGDRPAELHALASLRLQLELRLPDAIAEAHDQGHSWTDIANQLGVTRAAARRRYASNVRVPLAD
jgi:hypothetical protein